MKIRNGFVSNSSTSSFLIYGIEAEQSDFGKERVYNVLDKVFADEDDIDGYSPYGGIYYIGASWSSIRDNETGAEFKERIEKTLRDRLPMINWEERKARTIEAAWRDD